MSQILCRRDIFTVHLAERPGEAAAAMQSSADAGSRWECPVTQLPCERAPVSALPACGHVLSERAIRQVRDDVALLTKCCAPALAVKLTARGTGCHMADAAHMLPAGRRGRMSSVQH